KDFQELSMHSRDDLRYAPVMRAAIYKLDSFTTRRFTGNPAAVVLLEKFPDALAMQSIAAENNLAETAFIVPVDDDYHIRWFTPTVEVPLCGHATLASAAVIIERLTPTLREIVFHSASGPLPVRRTETGYVMNFPARATSVNDAPPELSEALRV